MRPPAVLLHFLIAGVIVSAAPAVDEIRADDMVAHVRFLSDDLLAGRAPGTPGGQLAAKYLAAQFALAGLEPAGDDGTFFQEVPVVQTTLDDSFTLTASTAEGKKRVYKYPTEMVAFSDVVDPAVSFDGEVVFVGHGIVAPEFNWNDYAGLDVKGKIVLAMVNDPPAPSSEPDLFGGEALTYYGRWTYKYEEAARQGAQGAILIHTDESATYPWQVVESSWTGPQYDLPAEPGAPALRLKAWLTESAARELASLGGQDLDALRQAARARGASPTPLNVSVSGVLNQQVVRQSSPNVIGVLPGENTSEALVYTAHYDHLGSREGGDASADRIYNGARDNATGLAGILEIAQSFHRAGERPARSIYFVATTAEEAGLLGAEYFTAHPPIPIDDIVANINIDSLNIWGRTTDIVLLGAERSTLGEMAAAVASARGRRLEPDPEPERGYFFRSDHFPLAKAGVPALSLSESVEFVGKGEAYGRAVLGEYTEKHYHQPSDEYRPDWDLSGAVEDMQLLAELGWQIAAASEVPRYLPDDQFARPRQR